MLIQPSGSSSLHSITLQEVANFGGGGGGGGASYPLAKSAVLTTEVPLTTSFKACLALSITIPEPCHLFWVATWSGTIWEFSPTPYDGPNVIEARISSPGGTFWTPFWSIGRRGGRPSSPLPGQIQGGDSRTAIEAMTAGRKTITLNARRVPGSSTADSKIWQASISAILVSI